MQQEDRDSAFRSGLYHMQLNSIGFKKSCSSSINESWQAKRDCIREREIINSALDNLEHMF
jgi:hypothetical protein